MMDGANAREFDEPDHGPNLSAPIGEVPVATPGFRNAMTLLVLLSIPLWAMIIGGGILVARWLG